MSKNQDPLPVENRPRCRVTGNECGSDTHQAGHFCKCEMCQAWGAGFNLANTSYWAGYYDGQTDAANYCAVTQMSLPYLGTKSVYGPYVPVPADGTTHQGIGYAAAIKALSANNRKVVESFNLPRDEMRFGDGNEQIQENT